MLATECLKLIKNARSLTGRDLEHYEKFKEYNNTSEVYYTYDKIYNFIEEPFNPTSGLTFLVQIFNASRFCLSKLGQKSLFGVSISPLLRVICFRERHSMCFEGGRRCAWGRGAAPHTR